MSGDEALYEPLVEEIEAERAQVKTDEDVTGHGQHSAGLRPDEGVTVGDAHRGEQHETEEDGVHQGHSGQQRKQPRSNYDVNYNGS